MRSGLLSLTLWFASLLWISSAGAQPDLPQLNTDCEAPFAYFYGNPADDFGGHTMTSDGSFLYIGGRQNEQAIISKLRPDGQVIWTRRLSLTGFGNEVIDLKVDQEGYLIGCGHTRATQSPEADRSFAFKIDPEAGAILWTQVYSEEDSAFFLANELLDRAAGAAYVLLGQAQHNGPLNTGCDATLYLLNRADGSLVGTDWHYNLGSCETFAAGVATGGNIYATGRFNFSNTNSARMRPAVMSMDGLGNPIWSRLYLEDINRDARLFSSDIRPDGNDHLVIAAHGDQDGVNLYSNAAWLLRLTRVGRAQWARKFTFPVAVRSEGVVPLEGNGYLLLVSAPEHNRLYLSHIDGLGQLRWSRSIEDVSVRPSTSEMIRIGEQVYLTTTLQDGDRQRLALFRFQVANGELPLNCIPSDTLSPLLSTNSTPYNGFNAVSPYRANPQSSALLAADFTELRPLEQSCLPDCNSEELCDNNEDDDGDGLIDCDDPDLADDCCCYTPPLLNLGPDQSLCDGSPLSLSVNAAFTSVRWSTGDTTQVLNPTASGTYSVTVSDRCGNPQSDTITLVLGTSIETREIRQICPGEAVDIFGQPQTTAGEYSMSFSSTSGCDSVHTIILEVLATTETRTNQTICRGDSILIFGQNRSTAGVYSSTFVGSNGCDSTHIVELQVLDPVLTTDTLALQCAGSTIELFGQTVSEAGTYEGVFTASTGCDSTHRVTVSFAEPIIGRDTLVICAGESVDIFGQLRNEPGEYTANFTAANGCDSTHITSLVEDSINVSFNIFPNCPSTDPGFIVYVRIRGNGGPYRVSWNGRTFYNQTLQPVPPGEHVVTISSADGCIYEVPLIVEDPRDAWWWALRQLPTCHDPKGGSVAIANDLPGLSYSLDGQEFTNQPQIENLAAGSYPIQLKYGDGCVFTDTLEIPAPKLPAAKLPADRTIAPGETTRIIPLSSDRPGQQYQWQPEQHLDCKDCYQVMARPTKNTEYEFVVTGANGCVKRDRMWIFVEDAPPYYVPNVFSPNRDGRNDYFTLFAGAEVREIKRMEIFDRWGGLVFRAQQLPPGVEKMGWDGQIRGRPLPAGAYAYFLQIELADGTIQEVKGSVHLLR